MELKVFAGKVCFPIEPVPIFFDVCKSTISASSLVKVRGRMLDEVSIWRFASPGNEKLAGERLNSVGTLALKSPVA